MAALLVLRRYRGSRKFHLSSRGEISWWGDGISEHLRIFNVPIAASSQVVSGISKLTPTWLLARQMVELLRLYAVGDPSESGLYLPTPRRGETTACCKWRGPRRDSPAVIVSACWFGEPFHGRHRPFFEQCFRE